jgi:molybdenum cofactor cytidylyltransferase
MDLVKRFRLGPDSKVALVGSGGKTTLLFELARAFQSRVICTTTTHMAQDQLRSADHHIEVIDINDIPERGWQGSGDVILFTGPPVETNRVKGPNPAQLSKILALSDAWNCPLLVESDGARKLPLKAPAEHEPPIPDFVNTVITVIGLSGLGKPLNEEWVHRPALFSQLTGLEVGEIIHSTHLVEALISNEGGLKNIPPGVQKILVINQIDTFPNWKTFYDQLDLLLKHYHQVAFGVLEDQLLLEVHHRIAGIILAAGGSQRFGVSKQLLDWKGLPLVEHVARIGLEAGLNPVIVVTGSNSEKVSMVLSEDVQVVHNPDWQVGQSSSVIAGVESLPDRIGGVVFLLVDQPLIPSDLIRLLIQKHSRSQAAILCPDAGDHPGNPVLFDRDVFEELKHLSGDHGGKALFDKYIPLFVKWDDPNIQLDIDSQDDYHKLLEISTGII